MDNIMKHLHDLKIYKYLSDEYINELSNYAFSEEIRSNSTDELSCMMHVFKDDNEFIGTIICTLILDKSLNFESVTTELEIEYSNYFDTDYINVIEEKHQELIGYDRPGLLTLNNWFRLLLQLSIEYHYDFVSGFLSSKEKFNVDESYLSNTELPIELKEYFSNNLGEVCNNCGCLMSRSDTWGESNGHSVLEAITYNCRNCGYSRTEKQDTSCGCKEETIKYYGYDTGKRFSDLVSNPIICEKCNNSRVLNLMSRHTGRTFTWCPKCNAEYNEDYISLPCEENSYWDSLPPLCYEVEWAKKQRSDNLVDLGANDEQSSNEKDYIECPSCHNKILGKYWLNVKYQGHNNYGGYEEDIYTGECPICSETIETSELELYTNSLEAEETELQQYYKVIGNFGYDSFPFEDCDYCYTCAADELKYIKNALDNLNDILNVKYLYNIYNIQAVQSNKIYDYNSEVITNIFRNTSYADFNIDSIKDCKFRLLDCSAFNDTVEEDTFDTPIINLLLQVIRNNKILGYIEVSQQYPLDNEFIMFEVKKDSNKKLVELCKFYTDMYTSREDTHSMLSKSRTDGFNTPVCKKCGQLFCDCNLRCPICGKVFCEHKYKL